MAAWGQTLLDVLLPPACHGCGTHISGSEGEAGVCPACWMRLPNAAWPRCRRCDASLAAGTPDTMDADVCATCSGWPDCLVGARSVTLLEAPADRLVHALKYHGWRSLGGPLGRRMAQRAIPPTLDVDACVVVPIPTTTARETERGYNQAAVLAEAVAGELGRPVVSPLVRTGKSTQVGLHRDERWTNVRGAFAVRGNGAIELGDRAVLLVDDVLTTGATASAVATVLNEAGVSQIWLTTFARAAPFTK